MKDFLIVDIRTRQAIATALRAGKQILLVDDIAHPVLLQEVLTQYRALIEPPKLSAEMVKQLERVDLPPKPSPDWNHPYPPPRRRRKL